MSISRRAFLKSAAGGGLLFAAGVHPSTRLHAESPRRAGNALRYPSDFTGGELVASVVQKEVWPGTPTSLWTFGGSYPAPTIRMRSGEQLSVRLTNSLAEPTNIHWHGLRAPSAMDGHPKDMVAAGASFDYTFPVRQRAGTYWYHPHPDMATAKQTYMGMAGLFIVGDDEESALALPRDRYDIPLVIQDRRQAGSKQIIYQPTADDHNDGYLGDTILVNGTPDPFLDVDRGLYRFRVLNGSNARIFKLGFSDGRSFQLIATDGGLLDKPYTITSTFLSPGERVEILVDFGGDTAGSSIELRSLEFDLFDSSGQGTPMSILRFDVTANTGWEGALPTTLSTIERLDASSAVRTRPFLLTAAQHGSMTMHVINGVMYDRNRVDLQVKQGDIEIWSFVNLTSKPHPMHLHGLLFQVLDRNGSNALDPIERGWKDTVLVGPNETARIIARFDIEPGVFVLHCHNLEHEDEGMMLNVEVTRTSAVEEAGPAPTRMDLR